MGIARGPVCGQGADDDIRAVSRGDDQASRLEVIEKVRQLHGADLEVGNLPVQPLGIPADDRSAERIGDLLHRRSIEKRLFREYVYGPGRDRTFTHRCDEVLPPVRGDPVDDDCDDVALLLLQ